MKRLTAPYPSITLRSRTFILIMSAKIRCSCIIEGVEKNSFPTKGQTNSTQIRYGKNEEIYAAAMHHSSSIAPCFYRGIDRCIFCTKAGLAKQCGVRSEMRPKPTTTIMLITRYCN